MTKLQVWHSGERMLQERAGIAARMAEAGPRVLRAAMPEQHRSFFAELPLLFAAVLDRNGQPCVSLLAGPPGFAASPQPDALRVAPAWSEGLGEGVHPGAPMGLLGLQAHTGRRNRLNGRIARVDPSGFEVAVTQSFGNCPRYIRRRRAEFTAVKGEAAVSELHALDQDTLRMVSAADTFFIATAHPCAGAGDEPAHGLDVSHRGGPAGFVQVTGGDTLVVPDYSGNGYFNTLGNLQVEPRCGLLFLHFATGDRVRIHARGAVQSSEQDRKMVLHVTAAWHARGGVPLRWIEPQE